MVHPQKVTDLDDLKLTRLFRYMVINITITYILAAAFYADPFYFWQHALSELGTTVSLLGTPNPTSSIILTVGMFINGRLLLETARFYWKNPSYTSSRSKSWLLYIASLGSFITIFPNNLFHVIHSIGSALMIGSIFFMDLLILKDQHSAEQSFPVYLVVGFLWLSVLAYAATFFAGLEIKQVTQKICVISLLVVFYQESSKVQHISNVNVHPRLT